MGQNDGLHGGSIFNTSRGGFVFPSLRSGQYDLYELHTGNYVQGSSRTGANPNLTADPAIGPSIKATRGPLAFDVKTTNINPGCLYCSLHMNIPHQAIQEFLVDNRNFFSYRLPVLEDYSPDGIPTPKEERDRFFVKEAPDTDQENPGTDSILNSRRLHHLLGRKTITATKWLDIVML